VNWVLKFGSSRERQRLSAGTLALWPTITTGSVVVAVCGFRHMRLRISGSTLRYLAGHRYTGSWSLLRCGRPDLIRPVVRGTESGGSWV